MKPLHDHCDSFIVEMSEMHHFSLLLIFEPCDIRSIVDRVGHGGGDEGVVRLLQLDDDLLPPWR